MAYRRKTYRKRFMKRKKKFFKKRTFRRKTVNNPKSYTGQLNVCCDITLPMYQTDANDGVKMCFLWGLSSGELANVTYGWNPNQLFSPYNTAEWNLYASKFQEYTIRGVKINIIPATYIGDQADGRTTRQLHIGSCNELQTQAQLTVSRLQISSDYGGYSMNTNTPSVKRYYRPAAFNKRQGNIIYAPTSQTTYVPALTYMYWQISGVDTDNLVVGDVRVQYYIQFRKPKVNQVV